MASKQALSRTGIKSPKGLHPPAMTTRIQWMRRASIAVLLLAAIARPATATTHPMDPLSADEI